MTGLSQTTDRHRVDDVIILAHNFLQKGSESVHFNRAVSQAASKSENDHAVLNVSPSGGMSG